MDSERWKEGRLFRHPGTRFLLYVPDIKDIKVLQKPPTRNCWQVQNPFKNLQKSLLVLVKMPGEVWPKVQKTFLAMFTLFTPSKYCPKRLPYSHKTPTEKPPIIHIPTVLVGPGRELLSPPQPSPLYLPHPCTGTSHSGAPVSPSSGASRAKQ